MRVARVVDLRVSLGGGRCVVFSGGGSCRQEMVQRDAERSTEAMYMFRKHWPVYTGLEKHAALCHLIARPMGHR